MPPTLPARPPPSRTSLRTELGAAAYAIKAARAAAPDEEAEAAGRLECQWQRAQLPSEIRELVLDDQHLRNDICWFVFEGASYFSRRRAAATNAVPSTRDVVGKAWIVSASVSIGTPVFTASTASWIASGAPGPAMNVPSTW